MNGRVHELRAVVRPRRKVPQMARAMTEDELLQAITEVATLAGWRWHHVRRSDKALQMGHAGYPDLTMARGGELLFYELKRTGGKPTTEQWEWLDALAEAGVTAEVVEPADLDAVIRRLTRQRKERTADV